MKLNRCHTCHSHISLEALVQDEAGRELLSLLKNMDTLMGAALISYLGLFRSAKRDLSNERALRLASDVLELSGDLTRLSIALSETVEALRSKDERQKLTNHRYLEKVLESVEARPLVAHKETKAVAPKSKSGQAYLVLESLK